MVPFERGLGGHVWGEAVPECGMQPPRRPQVSPLPGINALVLIPPILSGSGNEECGISLPIVGHKRLRLPSCSPSHSLVLRKVSCHVVSCPIERPMQNELRGPPTNSLLPASVHQPEGTESCQQPQEEAWKGPHPVEPSDETTAPVNMGLFERKRVFESHALHTVP